MNIFFKLSLGFVASLFGAYLAQYVGVPLPWTLGPLLIIAALRLLTIPVSSSSKLRNVGQWIIGLTLGLYFTPQVFSIVVSHWFAMFAGLIFALLLAAYGTFLLHRLGRVDLKTAWFSSAIGGANEMAILAERYAVRPDLVASAHTVRLVLVVLVVPFVCKLFNVAGIDVSAMDERVFSFSGFVWLGLLSSIAGLIAHHFKITNAWVLGPMFVAIFLTINQIHLSTVPPELSKIAQLFIGGSLGDRFRPGFFNKAPLFLLNVVVFSISSLFLGFGFALLLVQLTELPLTTLAVSVAPGGIAEMAITAKVLQIGAPVVTAFQVSRMVGVVLLTGPLYKNVVSKLEKPSKVVPTYT